MLAAAEAAEAQLLDGAEENLRRAVRCGVALVATKGVVAVLIRARGTILDIGVGDETNDSPPRDALLVPHRRAAQDRGGGLRRVRRLRLGMHAVARPVQPPRARCSACTKFL
jgi:hypothetical protein